MTHLMLTSALLFALLAVVATAIGASLGIARDLMLDDAEDAATAAQSVPAREGLAAGQGLGARQGFGAREGFATGEGFTTRPGHGLAEDFGLGLQHATHFAQDPGRSFSRNRSFRPRV
jgi:hypothetical protein